MAQGKRGAAQREEVKHQNVKIRETGCCPQLVFDGVAGSFLQHLPLEDAVSTCAHSGVLIELCFEKMTSVQVAA